MFIINSTSGGFWTEWICQPRDTSRVNHRAGGAGAEERLLSHPLSKPAEPAQGPNSESKWKNSDLGLSGMLKVGQQTQKHFQHCWGMPISAPSPSLTSAGWLRNPSGASQEHSDSHILQKAK